jgi:acyl carrier protein
LSREEILHTLSGVFEEVLGRPVELTETTTAADVDGWDSVAQVMLVVASEEEFDVRFESAELADAQNVGDFITLVERKQTPTEAAAAPAAPGPAQPARSADPLW